MELKHYQRQNCVAVWSNSKAHGQLLACASPNLNNSSLFDLQILSVDLSDPAKTLQVQGKSLYDTTFRCLAWGTFGQRQGTLPYGIVFGGMDNGSFTLWNPAQMIGKHDEVHESHIRQQSSILYFEQIEDEQQYPILCAQWNAIKNNYLAFGSNSLLILDVGKDISSPGIFKPSQNNPHEGSYITSVAWNKQVSNILASAGSDGLIALYDIKVNRSIFNFKDNSSNNNQRQVQVAWSKQISTQIAVALDDDKKNQLQIWDLRNQKGPIVVIDRGHSRGINTMDWSQLDHDLILTASRDNKINCWNYKQDQQPLSSRKIQSEIVKVAWSKSLPSIYSVTTTDGLSICSLDDRNIHSYIPKWLKVSSSSTFNGNEQLITYSQQRGNNLIEYKIKTEIKQQLSQQIAILQQFLQNQNVELLKQAEGQIGQFWKLISFKKNQEGDSDIYQFLGLNKDKIIKQVEKYTGKKRDISAGNNTKHSKKNKSKSSKADYIPVPVTQAANFFGSLSSQPLDKSFNNKNNNQDQNEIQNIKYDMVPRNSNWDIGKQKLIKQNLLIGNYDGAIDAALKSGRTAQALLIAYSIDQTTFNNTLKTFCTQTTDKFISGILRHIAFKDTEELVNRYDLNRWKQCVALIYSLSSSDKRKNLLNILAKRLQSQQHQQAAIYCYILSEDFSRIVQIYQQRLSKQRAGTFSRKLKVVISGTRLLAILSCLTINVKVSTNFQKIIRQLAFICLQANKKLLSYNLLTKYIGPSSNKYINYLIHNTQQLSAYRNQNNPIINLPAMAKRQQKIKKVAKGVQYQEEVPTNIKPNSKQLKLIPKNAFDDGQINSEKMPKSKGGNVPPPPPPVGVHHNRSTPVQPPPSLIQKTKNMPPPPPPAKKNQPFAQQEDEDEQQQVQQKKQTLPSFPAPKKGGVPPPPPPPKTNPKTLNTSQQQSHSSKHLPPPPPVKIQNQQSPHYNTIKVPPPPPSHTQHPTTVTKQQLNQQRVPPPPPPSVNRSMPPPPSRQVVQKQQPQQDYQQRQQQTVRKQMPPPPVKHSPPPAPIAKTSQLPPPVSRQPIRKQQQPQYDESDQQAVEQQPQKKNVTKLPPPPTPKKVGPPPPPSKAIRVQSQQSQNQQQQETNTSYQQQQQFKKTVPPPPGRKVPPPPPSRK